MIVHDKRASMPRRPRDRRRCRFESATPLFSMVLLVAIGGTPWHCRPGSLARLAVPDDVGVDAKSNMEVSKPPCRRDNGEHVGSREPRSWPDDWPVIRPGPLAEPRRVSTGRRVDLCSAFCVLCRSLLLRPRRCSSRHHFVLIAIASRPRCLKENWTESTRG